MHNGDPNLNSQEMNTETSPHWSNTGSANCLPVGTRLAEFEITGVVGEGGFGNVYLAFDHSLQRTVAIKEYMPVALASRGADGNVLVQSKRHRETFQTGMNSFINEARLLAQFDHPALIKVHRFWEQNNTAYMAMRYYEGQTFKNIIKKHPELVTEAWLKPILKPILEALEVLYKIQILHRDISPDNIMIQTNGDAVLLDFGAARQIIGDMTQALTVILKPGYAPVEQYAEDSDMKQGPWTDIYALSAVVYSAIVKKPPPTSVTRLIKDPIDLLQNSVQAGFSKEFLAAIDKGMAVKAEDRPQTIAEFSRLLGIDKPASTEAIALPTPTAPLAQKKSVEGADRRLDPSKQQKSRIGSAAKYSSASKIPGKPRTKVSLKGSWALVIAGIVLASGAGIYRLSHPGIALQVAAKVAPPVGTKTNPAAASSSMPVAAEPASSALAAATPNKNDNHAASVTDSPNDGTRTGMPKAAASERHGKPTTHHAGSTTTAADTTALIKIANPAPSKTALAQTDIAIPIAMATIRLTIKPWATVLVDGSTKGVSPPLKRIVLPEGKHQIRLVNPNFPDHAVDIMVNNNKRFNGIDYDFSSH